jgi:hypothetical protein
LVTNSEVWESEDGNNWTLSAIAPWEPRHTYGTLVHDDKMWILGGDQLQCSFQTDIWNSDNGTTWNLVNESAPWGERMLHMYFAFDNKMWVMGGQKIVYCTNTVEEAYNDVWNSTDGITWNLVTDSAAWSPRGMAGGSCVFNNKMWIFGGGIYQKKYHNDIWNSDDGINWNLVSEKAPWESRQYHSVAVFDSAMWVMGGRYDSDRNDVWFTKDGIKWYNLKGTPWLPRHAGSVFNHDNSLWMAAGYLHNDVWRLNVLPCPDIVTQPFSQDVIAGKTAAFIARSPTPSAAYQWQVFSDSSWQNLMDTLQFSGSFSDTLKISNISSENSGYSFRFIATEGACTATSEPAYLNVCPDFTVKPSDITVPVGESAFLVAHYPDSSSAFQWQINKNDSGWYDLTETSEFAGISNDTLWISNISLENHGVLLRCRVSTSSCSVYSESATLSVCPEIKKQPYPETILPGASATFKIEYPRTPAEYEWQIFDGSWKTLADSSRYEGINTHQLIISSGSTTQDDQLLRCFVSSGTCSAISDTVTLSVCGPENLIMQKTQAGHPGDTLIINIQHGDSSHVYQWQMKIGSDWEALGSQDQFHGVTTDSLTISNINMGNNGQEFRLIVSDSVCTAASSSLKVAVCPLIEDESFSQNAAVGGEASFWVRYQNDEASLFQWQINDGTVWKKLTDDSQFSGSATDKLVIENIAVRNNGHQFRCLISSETCFEISSAMTLTVSSAVESAGNRYVQEGQSASFSIKTSTSAILYQWETSVGSEEWISLKDGSQFSGSTTESITVINATLENNKQLFRCHIFYEEASEISPTMMLTVCPIIKLQPSDQHILNGETATFSVKSSADNASYQWQRYVGAGWQNIENGNDFAGSDSSELVVLHIGNIPQGQLFRCTITWDECSEVSDSVSLNYCPNIESQPKSQVGAVGDTVFFNVKYPYPSASYRWQVNYGMVWEDLTATEHYHGTATDSLTITSISNGNNGQQFRVIISDHECTVVSQTVSLSVCPTINSGPIDQSAFTGEAVKFSIEYVSDSLATYQWQGDFGRGWEKLTESDKFSGTITNILTVTEIIEQDDGDTFRCIVTTGMCATTSESAVLKVLAVPDPDPKMYLNVYPNPAHNSIRVVLKKEYHKTHSFAISDPVGKVLMTGNLNTEVTEIDISDLPLGFYFLKLKDDVQHSIKIVKK